MATYFVVNDGLCAFPEYTVAVSDWGTVDQAQTPFQIDGDTVIVYGDDQLAYLESLLTAGGATYQSTAYTVDPSASSLVAGVTFINWSECNDYITNGTLPQSVVQARQQAAINKLINGGV